MREVFLRLLHLLLVEQAHVAESAVGKGIDNGTSEVSGCGVVDECSEVGSDGGAEDNEDDVEVAAFGGCAVGCGRHHEFTGNGDDGALKCHQEGDGPVVEVLDAPGDEGGQHVMY